MIQPIYTGAYEKLAFDAGSLVMDALSDDDITEIMLNPDGQLWVEKRRGGMQKIGRMSAISARAFIYSAAGLVDRTVNKHCPYLETELPFGRARFEATIPPITENCAFTIRKRAKFIYTMNDYIESGIIKSIQAEAVEDAIINKKSILICGAPGTGKTTFANACIDSMTKVCSPSERIYTIEDVPELQIKGENVYSTYTDSISGTNHAKLLHIALRSRPDRILVGEVRDGAMLELLKAWNVGCSGIATVHSNTATADAALQRCMDLAMEKTQTPPVSLICESINMVVSIERSASNSAGRIVNNVAVLEGRGDDNKFKFKYIK